MRDMSLKLKRTVLDNNWNKLKCELITPFQILFFAQNWASDACKGIRNSEVPNTKRNPGVNPPHGSGCIFGSSIMFHLVG